MAPQDWLTDDLYDILGVPQDSTDDTLRRAYRSLVRRHHPDVNAGCPRAERRFKEVGAAYAVLSDRRRRAQYDLARLRTRRPSSRTARARYGSAAPGYPFDGFTADAADAAAGPADHTADTTADDVRDGASDRSRRSTDDGTDPRMRSTDPATSRPSPGGVAPMGGWGAMWWAPAAWSTTAWTTAAQAVVDATFWWAAPWAATGADHSRDQQD